MPGGSRSSLPDCARVRPECQAAIRAIFSAVLAPAHRVPPARSRNIGACRSLTSFTAPSFATGHNVEVFPYEGIYVALVQVLHSAPEAGTLDVQLAVSRDSIHFTRLGGRGAFIPLGPVGSFTAKA